MARRGLSGNCWLLGQQRVTFQTVSLSTVVSQQQKAQHQWQVKTRYMSWYSVEAVANSGIDMTAAQFVQKPFTAAALAQAVQAALVG